MWTLLGVILVSGLGYGAYRYYVGWEGERLDRRAKAYLEYGDPKSAALTARRAFQLNPSDAEACRILAEISERQGQESALDWRQQALALNPTSPEDLIALAKTALQFNKMTLAENTLAKLGPNVDQLPTYHDAAAQLALAKKDSSAAEKHFAEAVRLAPSNKVYQLKLAVLQLQSSSAEIKEHARAVLHQLLDDQTLRVPAARALRDDAVQRQATETILQMAQSLKGYPEATFRDRLSYVQVLRALNHPSFATELSELETEAAGDPNKLIETLAWMSANRLAVLAIHWIKSLPPELTSKRPVPIAVADCYVAASDWDGLQQWCKNADWGDLEFLRRAYVARVLRERGDTLGFKSEWNTTLQDAGSNGDKLFSLEQAAVKWGWKKEAEDLLWMLAKDPEKQSSALAGLNQYYSEKGDTGNLYRVVARFCEIKPEDESAQNNFAQLSLLLDLNTERAQAAAEQLYNKDPKNAVFASTYGFALYRAGRYQQAVKVMNGLTPDELRQPAIAVYYGIFLAAAGDKAKAAEYLERGATAPLLPEEKTLLQTAQNKLHGKP